MPGTRMQYYIGDRLPEVKAQARAAERQACAQELLDYAATLPGPSATPYRHAAQMLQGTVAYEAPPESGT